MKATIIGKVDRGEDQPMAYRWESGGHESLLFAYEVNGRRDIPIGTPVWLTSLEQHGEQILSFQFSSVPQLSSGVVLEIPEGHEYVQPVLNCIFAETIQVHVGSLKITSEHGKGTVGMGHKVRVEINGEPVKVKKLTLHVEVGEVISAEVEFLP